MKPKVGLMIVGAQKCGTTSLAQQLAQHPAICFCADKEPHFFSKNPRWHEEIDRYHDLFRAAPGQLLAEASTTYTFGQEYPDTARRIHEYNPDLKAVYIVRNPIHRIESHYAHRLMRGRALIDIEQELAACPEYLDRSRYFSQILPYSKLFGPEHVRVLVFESFVADPRASLLEIVGFLGLAEEPARSIDVEPKNVSTVDRLPQDLAAGFHRILAHSPPLIRRLLSGVITIRLRQRPRIVPKSRAIILEQLQKDIEDLEQAYDLDLALWRSDEGGDRNEIV